MENLKFSPFIQPEDTAADFETPEKAETMTEQIRFYFKPRKIVTNKIKRGRPEQIKNCSMKVLNSLILAWERELQNRLKRDQRSDASFASISRYIKKIPDIFLKYIGSKCQYKSREIRVVVKSYLRSFLDGFIKIFKCPSNVPQIEYFIDYIILCFPEAKVYTILETLCEENTITQAQFEDKADQLKIRVKASKICFQELHRRNVCFQAICETLQKQSMKHLTCSERRRVTTALRFTKQLVQK